MVLTFVGRRSDDPCSDDSCYLKELLANALKDMVLQVYHEKVLYGYKHLDAHIIKKI
jgi:4-hydroxy-L-threonine phosphate dehydrogenase PdxA